MSESSVRSKSDVDTGGWAAAEADADIDGDDDDDVDDWDDGYGSETENDFLALTPATTESYIFVANPARDTVSRITVPTLEVITVEVGSNPQVIATTDDYARAVTFNQDSEDLSIIDAATLEVSTVELRPNLNQMVLSPDGLWALCYHDPNIESQENSGASSTYEVSFVHLETLEHFPLVPGFTPQEVAFTPDGSLALIVGDAYLAVIDLYAEDLDPEIITIADDVLDPPQAEEVELAPDGSFAFVRQYGTDEIIVVDLVAKEATAISVGANPTDLDISPDGTKAAIVARASQELWILDVADPFAPAEVIDLPEDELLGSLLFSPDGATGILYTTASLTEHYAVWDMATGEVEVRGLVKPISSIAISPTSTSLLVFHTLEDAVDSVSTDLYYGEHAISLIDLDDFRSNAIGIEGEPTAYANSDNGEFGFFIMEGIESLMVLEYNSLLYEATELKSSPVHVGTLPGSNYAWVNQEHDLGRLSFYDADTDTLQTITGFELNSEIESY
jgi:DNA-binding beta-propeller fold protein YncE